MNIQHISDGLQIGLYVHTINGQIVDGWKYLNIISLIRETSCPLTIGFNKYPPLDEDADSVQLLMNCGYSWIDIQCAWQQLNKQQTTFTSQDSKFTEKMMQILFDLKGL